MEIPVACEAVGIPAGGVAGVLVGVVPMDLPGWLVEIPVACEGATVPAGGATGVSVDGVPMSGAAVSAGGIIPAGGVAGVVVGSGELPSPESACWVSSPE